jgi:hypothetical protein
MHVAKKLCSNCEFEQACKKRHTRCVLIPHAMIALTLIVFAIFMMD